MGASARTAAQEAVAAAPVPPVARRIRRDGLERGYDVNDVLYRFEHHVMPVYESLIEPLKHQADFIIPNNQNVDVSASVIAGYLRSMLK